MTKTPRTDVGSEKKPRTKRNKNVQRLRSETRSQPRGGGGGGDERGQTLRAFTIGNMILYVFADSEVRDTYADMTGRCSLFLFLLFIVLSDFAGFPDRRAVRRGESFKTPSSTTTTTRIISVEMSYR